MIKHLFLNNYRLDIIKVPIDSLTFAEDGSIEKPMFLVHPS